MACSCGSYVSIDPTMPSWKAAPDTKVGTFTQALYDQAKKQGWTVISMKNEWKRIVTFDN
jgi:hypothetical protein